MQCSEELQTKQADRGKSALHLFRKTLIFCPASLWPVVSESVSMLVSSPGCGPHGCLLSQTRWPFFPFTITTEAVVPYKEPTNLQLCRPSSLSECSFKFCRRVFLRCSGTSKLNVRLKNSSQRKRLKQAEMVYMLQVAKFSNVWGMRVAGLCRPNHVGGGVMSHRDWVWLLKSLQKHG